MPLTRKNTGALFWVGPAAFLIVYFANNKSESRVSIRRRNASSSRRFKGGHALKPLMTQSLSPGTQATGPAVSPENNHAVRFPFPYPWVLIIVLSAGIWVVIGVSVWRLIQSTMFQ